MGTKRIIELLKRAQKNAYSLLAGCLNKSKKNRSTWNIYQAPILILPAGTEVQTEDGIYKTQTREVWYPEFKVIELEKRIINQ